MYLIGRHDKNGRWETIVAHQRCKGWKVLKYIRGN